MQRIPTRSIPIKNNMNEGPVGANTSTAIVPRGAGSEEEASPILPLARRIRAEQGAEQVKAFLEAMRPFAAPNELKHIGRSFGIELSEAQTSIAETRPTQSQPANASSAMPQLQMLQRLICLQNLMNGGKADTSDLMRVLGGMQ